MMRDQLEEIEQLSQTLSLIKQYLKRLEIPKNELKKYRKKIDLSPDYPLFGVELQQLRTLARDLNKYYKSHDFARFFKLFESLWINEENSLEERYLAMLLMQSRRRDLDEPDVCLDAWNWIWREENLRFIQNWTLVEHIANTVTYQIMEAWFEIKEASDIIWNDLKEHAFNEDNKWEQCLAILTPLKRLSKNPEWVLPTLEMIVFALRTEDPDVGRAIEMVLRESAKADSDMTFKFIKRFKEKSPVITANSLKYISRYFSVEQKKELGL
ncbi:MAG: DNA alkylation repair protein [Candidatus Hodarchaeales archaeon]|jgi:hypothetical protein